MFNLNLKNTLLVLGYFLVVLTIPVNAHIDPNHVLFDFEDIKDKKAIDYEVIEGNPTRCFVGLDVRREAQNSSLPNFVGDLSDIGDDGGHEITIPFPFVFYDKIFTRVLVANNGGVYLIPDDSTTEPPILFPENTRLPNASSPYGIFPFWDDMGLGDSAGDDGVYVIERISTSLTGEFVGIQWNRPHFPNIGNSQFALFLFTDGFIGITYTNTTFGDPEIDLGKSATVGIQGIVNGQAHTKQLSLDSTIDANQFCLNPILEDKGVSSDSSILDVLPAIIVEAQRASKKK